MSAEVVNIATLQSFTLGGSGGMLPEENLIILGVLRRILMHSEKHTELLEKRLIIKTISAELLGQWKPTPSARVYIIYYRSITYAIHSYA